MTRWGVYFFLCFQLLLFHTRKKSRLSLLVKIYGNLVLMKKREKQFSKKKISRELAGNESAR
jgi:hypothetical protein